MIERVKSAPILPLSSAGEGAPNKMRKVRSSNPNLWLIAEEASSAGNSSAASRFSSWAASRTETKQQQRRLNRPTATNAKMIAPSNRLLSWPFYHPDGSVIVVRRFWGVSKEKERTNLLYTRRYMTKILLFAISCLMLMKAAMNEREAHAACVEDSMLPCVLQSGVHSMSRPLSTITRLVAPLCRTDAREHSPTTMPTDKLREGGVSASEPQFGSGSPCFVPVDKIAQLSMEELSHVFEYATSSNVAGFNERAFRKNLSPATDGVVTLMNDAVKKSIGVDARISRVSELGAAGGKTDALLFAAAMRLLAEWRMLRQVPEGFKGYEMGMQLGTKDVIQNAAKIEAGVHAWLNYIRGTSSELASPTVAQLIQFEIDSGVHPSRPKLEDNSATMGLLWGERQLDYQLQIISNVLKVPAQFTSTGEAVAAAYNSVYGSYHGWAIQKIFNFSFQAAPDVMAIYRQMMRGDVGGSHHLAGNRKEVHPIVRFLKDIRDKTKDGVDELWRKFHNKHIKNLDNAKEANPNTEIDGFQIASQAQMQISLYLKSAAPMLLDVRSAIHELGVNDPSKV